MRALGAFLLGVVALTTSGAAAAPQFLALGDSYTIGEGVEPAERWPVMLAARLRAEGVAIADPTIIARTGWTTDELAAAIEAAQPGSAHALVTLLIGVNDQYRGRAVEPYRERFAALLERAIGFAGGRPERVVVLSIPDWGVTPFAAAAGRGADTVAAEIDAFNAAALAVTTGRDVAFVDVTGISREPDPDRTLLTGDGLHPSAEQYRRWVERVLPVVRARLAPAR